MSRSSLWSSRVPGRSSVTPVPGTSGLVAQGFPSFRLDALDVRRGAVKVVARSPSGQTFPLEAVETNGVCSTNFIPTEIGDWQISILHEDVHIEGSPFNVRVYDPTQVRVTGLNGGTIGQTYKFTIDTSGAGEGQLAVDITFKGRVISAQVIPDHTGLYHVSFVPEGCGVYQIRVYFAGMEITGSPFMLEIVDSSSNVSASGEGLRFVEVHHPASFNVHTGRPTTAGDLQNIQAYVRSPVGMQKLATVTCDMDGSYRVEYTPHDVGEFKVDVLYRGEHIAGSPFSCQVYDSNQVVVSNLPRSVGVGQPVDFNIDVSQAGCGNLEIVVNNGQIPCSVEQRSNRTFRASFLPRDLVTHYINISFNGRSVPGSPWQVDVHNAQNAGIVTATGSGLKQVPVGHLASFDVDGASPTDSVTATILSPSGMVINGSVSAAKKGLKHVEYLPTEVGNYKVTVRCNGSPVSGSPWTAKAYSTAAIKLDSLPSTGAVGVSVEFTVDVTRAGEGQLEIMVNHGTVANTVRMIKQGVFQVSFVPREVHPHIIDIKFNGEPLPSGPATVAILDVSQVTVKGDGLQRAAVNKPATFHVATKTPGTPDVSVKIVAASGSGHEVPVIIRGNSNKGFTVEYTTREPGTYKANVLLGGIPIPRSPFLIKSYDLTRISVHGISDTIVGKPSAFTVDVTDAGEGNMEFSITSPSSRNISHQVNAISAGKFEVSYTPFDPGSHRANILFNTEHVPGSPFKFHVKDVSKVTATGSGLTNVACHRPASFTISSPGLQHHDLDIHITGPSGRVVNHRLFPSGKHGYLVEYTPTLTGDHIIDINYHGVPILGCPFIAKAWDARQVIVSNLQPGRVGKLSSFNVDASLAGAGNVEIIVTVGTENIPNFVNAEGDARFRVTFTPTKPETHSVSVKFNGEPVPGSPFVHEMLDNPHVVSLSNSMIRIPIDRPAVVGIDRGKRSLQSAAPVCEVICPSNKITKARLNETRNSMWHAEFIPREIGPHCIQVTVAGIEISGSPFACEVYDIGRIGVTIPNNGIVGRPYEFDVDVGSAGAGELEVLVKAGGYRVPSKLLDKGFRVYCVHFMPKLPVRHLAYVSFSDESVPGSPFIIDVEDSTMVEVRGRSVDSAPVRQPAQFTIDPSRAPFKADVKVYITGPAPVYRRVPFDIMGTFGSGWTVDWVPYDLGVHSIEVKYGTSHVVGSPFKCKVFDLSKVFIIRDDVTASRTTGLQGSNGDDVVFYVDASEAGAGNLEVVVHCTKTGTRIPNFLEAVDRNTGCFRIYFTPRPDCFNYQVDVSFNELPVASSPFYHAILDGHRATARGEGLERVLANKPTSFDVFTKAVGGEADLEVQIQSPSGRIASPQISGTSNSGYHVTYTPRETGCHMVAVKYADVDITGSPFTVEVYDVEQVRVISLPQTCSINQPVTFEAKTSSAGEGKLTVSVRGRSTQPLADITKKSPGLHSVTFTPVESGDHSVGVFFNDSPVPGSPFHCYVIDANTVSVEWDSLEHCHASQQAQLDIDLKKMNPAELKVKVTDPYSREVQVRTAQHGTRHIAEFTPKEVGPHIVEVFYASQPVPGSPFTMNVYDVGRVKLLNTPTTAMVGQDVDCTVDTSEAGVGDVDVSVTCHGMRLATRRQQLSKFSQRFTFVPTSAANHIVTVTFNGNNIVGSPITVRVSDPAEQMVLSCPVERAVAGSQAYSIIETRGADVNLSDCLVRVTAPSGELVPAQIVRQPGGDCRVEYSSKFTGRHLVEILYAGRAIMGSPFYVEIFDPNKVYIESTKVSGALGDRITFDIVWHNAGKADVGLNIVGPRGNNVPFDMHPTARGDRVSYVARESGIYQINVTYGGLTVPGCPLRHEIGQNASIAVHGDGLVSAVKDKMATFVVDGKGQRGDLVVQVDGPNSIAKCTIEPRPEGIYRVSYIPLEVGNYNITIRWNGQPVAGSPFHPTVVDPNKVYVVGGLESYIDQTSSRIALTLHEPFTMEFDTRAAGQGQLTADVRCSEGSLPVNIAQSGTGHYSLTFTPHISGEYIIRLLWNDMILPFCPIICHTATNFASRENNVLSSTPPPSSFTDKVILTGHGLTQAKVNRHAEFVIDGTEATPGFPDVKLTGLHTDLAVHCVPIGEKKYRCTYVPTLPGSYLLYILWSNRLVRGSPFKVTVSSATNASRIICSGEGLREGVLGQDLRAVIDARHAGSGELMAQCLGPSRLAYCELTDHCDGTFTLHVTPQEAGRHVLDIKYGGEHVPGSPFILLVSGAPDATMVVARGPGIEHGVLSTFQSHFFVETAGAGSGQLTVRVRGPKGAFRVEMQRDGHHERTIICRYDPMEAGVYIIQVMWSGVHVPGSPFVVHICNSRAELDQVRLNTSNYNLRSLDYETGKLLSPASPRSAISNEYIW